MDGCLENTKRRGKKAISVLGLLVVVAVVWDVCTRVRACVARGVHAGGYKPSRGLNTVTHDGAERLLATRVALERMAFESLQPAKGGA